MNNRAYLLLLIILVIVTLGVAILIMNVTNHTPSLQTQTVTVKPVSSQISADGTVTAQNQATLHFQTAGKLTYLPLKEGDPVSQGQTIAQLDSYALQKDLQLAANTYETAKNTNDQTQENQQAGVLEGQQRTSLDTTNKNSYANSPITESQVITDAVKRMVDNSQLAQNTAQLNVDLANYAVTLATLTSPLSGIITHEDVTVPYQNVTPVTSFTVADPTSLVFRADVSDSDIDYVSEGAPVTIMISGSQTPISGTVEKIYPTKMTFSNGQQGYQVDIQSDSIKNMKMDQTGTVLIESNTNSDVMLVPSWTVLGGTHIWVEENNKPVLKTITTGKIHGSDIEVLSGLQPEDKVITNPETVTEMKYNVL